MSKQLLLNVLRKAALAGDMLFVLWILFNAMDSGFKGTRIEILASIILIFLLILNGYFLVKKVNLSQK